MVIPHSSTFCGLLLISNRESSHEKTVSQRRGKTKRPNKVDFFKARGKAVRPKPFENNKVDFSKFKTHPPASDIAKLALPAGKVWPQPIEVLSPTKTVGLGVTKLNLG
jgi:hypothetical protein